MNSKLKIKEYINENILDIQTDNCRKLQLTKKTLLKWKPK